jgi:hypothetical protein
MSQDIKDIIQERLDAHLREIRDSTQLNAENVGRQVFLSLAAPEEVDAYNARLAYLELFGVPSPSDVLEFCLLHFVSNWAPAPEGKFYQIKSESFVTVSLSSCH